LYLFKITHVVTSKFFLKLSEVYSKTLVFLGENFVSEEIGTGWRMLEGGGWRTLVWVDENFGGWGDWFSPERL
jgi:hypothetical protein